MEIESDMYVYEPEWWTADCRCQHKWNMNLWIVDRASTKWRVTATTFIILFYYSWENQYWVSMALAIICIYNLFNCNCIFQFECRINFVIIQSYTYWIDQLSVRLTANEKEHCLNRFQLPIIRIMVMVKVFKLNSSFSYEKKNTKNIKIIRTNKSTMRRISCLERFNILLFTCVTCYLLRFRSKFEVKIILIEITFRWKSYSKIHWFYFIVLWSGGYESHAIMLKHWISFVMFVPCSVIC